MKTTADQLLALPLHARLLDQSAPPDATIVDRTRAAPPSAAMEQAVVALPRLSVASSADADLVTLGALGEGGMGIVQVARQRALSREVAVKRPRSDAAIRAIAISSLLSEAQIQGALEHPNVVPIHALGRDADDLPVLVMKRLSGVSWRALISDPAHPAWPESAGDRLAFHLETLMQVCNAVHFAHSRGVIHRDIKPSNVMVGAFGEVYLLDWGIAYSPRPDDVTDPTIVGTPAYLAPEMIHGTGPHLSAQTDVYLLGATLHEVLTGKVRHRGETVLDMLYDASISAPFDYPKSAPAELAALCNRAMSCDPGARPESALAFRQAVAEFLRHRGSIALADAAAVRLAELRRKGAFAAAARGGSGGADLVIRALFSEASFGFRQALLAWEGATSAREGLIETLTWMIQYELSRRNAEAAAALLSELPAAPPELAAQVKAQRTELARERKELTRLRSVARDIDTSVAFRPRLLAQLGLSLFLAVALFGLGRLRPEGPSHQEIILTYCVSALLVGAGLIGFGRVLLVTRMNWHIWTAVVLLLTAPALNHLLALLLGLPVSAALAGGLLIDAAIGAMYASSTSWALFPMPVGFLAGSLVVVAFPAHAVSLTAGAIMVTTYAAGFSARRRILEKETSAP